VHQAYWANESVGSHVQAAAWLNAGYQVEHVELPFGPVRFWRR
jgi:hypothetical protein